MDWHISAKLKRMKRTKCQMPITKKTTTSRRRSSSGLCNAIIVGSVVLLAVLIQSAAAGNCPHPAVPLASTYKNVSGGPDSDSWSIEYVCDTGFSLFGEAESKCEGGKWDKSELPHCAVNIALKKPAMASSTEGAGAPGNAVDGKASNVHEGRRCMATEVEKSPWFTIDLLDNFPVKHVKLTTRCCDDVPVTKAEIRVGNSTNPSDNQLCDWVPKGIEEGETKTLDCYDDLVGRYVSVVMQGVEASLSLCEVEVFSSAEMSYGSCENSTPDDTVAFNGKCLRFLDGEVTGYEKAEDECRIKFGDEAHLLHDFDEKEEKLVTSRLELERGSSKALMTWIGAQRNEITDEWIWATGSDVGRIDWGRGQPNNYNKEQNCAVLDSELDWKWNDISCRISGVVVCQSPPEKCPSPQVGEGLFTTGGRKVGDSVEFRCPVGEMPSGSYKIRCDGDGKWRDEKTGGEDLEPVSCKPVDCGQVSGLANGEVHLTDGRTTWGARVMFKCKKNYKLMNGDEERRCKSEVWGGQQPECVYTKCPELDKVANAEDVRQEGTPNSVGAKVYYTCKEGHKASGSLTRECRLGGEWSGEPARCEFVDCGTPPKLENGGTQLLDGRTSFGARAEYTCGNDYKINKLGSNVRKCQSNGRWSSEIITCEVIKCPAPRGPNGGRVSGYDRSVHAKVEFSCLTGHVLEGPSEVTCERSGEWSNSPPICRFVDCGAVRPVQSGTAHYVNGSTHLGSLVKYACDRSHDFSGLDVRECLDSGKWSGKEPTCTEIRCDQPPRPNNTIVVVSSQERLHGTSIRRSKPTKDYRVGSTLKYRCERGYILHSSDSSEKGEKRVMTRRCTTSGTWTGSLPECKFVDCEKPADPENGEVALQNNLATYYGSLAFYKCNDNFNLEGFERVRCESDGAWKPEAPKCTETLCKNLTNPENGDMTLTTLRIGGTATFTCEYGFALKGKSDLTCLSSGSWSSWPPTCSEIDCGEPDEIDNGRTFLANGTTKIGGVLEYHCFPGYERNGPFERVCGEDGYWSGREPSCSRPTTPPPPITILSDNTVDGTTNVRSGYPRSLPGPSPNADGSEDDNGSVATWIGVTLGLIVVAGLLILGLYFYRKQRTIGTKPSPPYRDRNSNNGNPANYSASGVYGSSASNGSGLPNGSQMPANVRSRPHQPPPIQMYSMDDGSLRQLSQQNSNVSGGVAQGPIYDTINDNSSSGGATSYSRSGSDYSTGSAGNPKAAPKRPQSTFNPPLPPIPPPLGARPNLGFQNDYDVPEGKEQQSQNNNGYTANNSSRTNPNNSTATANGNAAPQANGANPSGTVTVNGIAV